jgi:hypothetical protein
MSEEKLARLEAQKSPTRIFRRITGLIHSTSKARAGSPAQYAESWVPLFFGRTREI